MSRRTVEAVFLALVAVSIIFLALDFGGALPPMTTQVVETRVIHAAAPSSSQPATSSIGTSADLVAQGKKVFVSAGCSGCHNISGATTVGPVLGNVGNVASAQMIRKKIVDPAAYMAKGFETEHKSHIMPSTYGKQLSKRELDALVAYLTSLKDPAVNTPPFLDPKTKKPVK